MTANTSIPITEFLESTGKRMNWSLAAYWQVDQPSHCLRCVHLWPEHFLQNPLVQRSFSGTLAEGECVPGTAWQKRQPQWSDHLKSDPHFRRHELVETLGLHSGFALPIANARGVMGVLEYLSSDVKRPADNLFELLSLSGQLIGEQIEHQQTTEDLRSSEEKLRLLMDNTDDYVILFMGSDTVITDVNLGAEKILGWKRGDMIGQKGSVIFTPEDRAQEKDLHEVERAVENGKSLDERWHCRKNGSRLWSNGMLIALRHPDGELAGFVKIFRDFTAVKEQSDRAANQQQVLIRSHEELEARILERTRELQSKTDQLSHSVEELEQFAYVASHDLREPLRTVNSFSQLLQRRAKGKLDEESQECLRYVQDGVVRMNGLIDDLLQFARIRSTPMVRESVSVENVLQAVLANLHEQIRQGQAEVDIGEMPTLSGHRHQLERLFMNLISNALKFKSDRPTRITVRAQREDGAWTFSVKDNGIGISKDYFDRIFVIFQRLHTREEYSGSGIGLAICKKIVQRHGGRIWVQSKVGFGTTFYFTIPDDTDEWHEL